MRFAPLLILVIGCGQSDAPPLTVTEFEIRDDDVPARLVLTVTNVSRNAISVNAVTLVTTGKSLLYDPDFADRVPSGFDCRVVLLDHGEPLAGGASINVAAGESVELVAELQWQLPDDAPPMLSIAQGNFTVDYRGEKWTTAYLAAFVLQSQPGVLDGVADDVGDNRDNDRQLLTLLDRHSGAPSRAFTALRSRLRDADTK
jgi:hypothetical protein